MQNHFLSFKKSNKQLSLLFIVYFFFSFHGVSQTQNKKNENEKIILIDPAVKKVAKKKYQIARPFSCKRSAVKYNNKWGFVNESGIEIIPTIFDKVYDFKGKSTAVKKQNKWYLLNSNNIVIKNLDVDFVSAFSNGKARVVKNNQYASIDYDGNLTKAGWTTVNSLANKFYSQTNNANVNCPQNIDFELGNFTNWSCDTGIVKSTTDSSGIPLSGVWGLTSFSPSVLNSNEIISNPSITSLTNRHEIISRAANRIDPYGLFPIVPPDGSNYCLKLGSDQNDAFGDPFDPPGVAPSAKTESVEYNLNVSSPDLCFFYDYAVVLVDPANKPHNYYQKPRLLIEITDLNTGLIVPCGKIEYVSDSSLPSFFQSSIRTPDNSTIWCKSWTKVFVNLSKYYTHNLKVKFTITDCTLGAHWGYGYIDIEGCKVGATAKNSCTNSKTILDGPEGFNGYKWWTTNPNSPIANTRHASILTQLPVGTVVNLEITSYPNPITNEVCTDTLRVTVEQPSLSFYAGPDQTICSGDRVTIGSNPLVNCTYAWRPNPSNLSSYNTSQVFATPTATTEYIIGVRDTSTNCYVEDTVKVFVKAKPNLNINISSLCYNINGNYGPIKLSGADTYTWTDTASVSHLNIFNPNNDSATITNFTDSVAHYQITASNLSTGCVVDTNINLVVYPKPIALFNVPPPNCIKGNRFVFSSGSFINSGNNSTVSSNSWIINNGTPILGPDIFYTFPTVGVFPVKLISVSDRGCIDSVSNTVEVYPMPKADFTPPTAQCLSGNSFTFDTLATPPFGGSISSIKWSFGDNRTDTVSPTIHTYINSNFYNVQLVVTSDKGCKDTTTKRIQVYHMPNPYFPLPDSKCLLNNSYQFVSQSTAVAPATIQSNIWDFGDGINGVSGSPASHVYLNDGNIKVKLVSTSSDNCKDSIEQIFQIFPMPKADFTVPPVACFLNNNYLFTSNSTIITSQNPLLAGRIDSCFWNFGGTPRDTFGFSVRHQFTNPNQLSYPIRLICQTNHGCRDTTTKNINFLPTPLVSIDPGVPLSICSGDSIRLHATANPVNGSITNYQWSVGGTNIPGATTPNITVNTSGIYQITVTNTSQCSNTSANDSVVVHPLPLGNVILPNKDYICEFYNMLLNSTSNASSYQWYLNGNSIPGANSPSYLATQPGLYAVKLTSTFGCENYADGRINLNLRKKPIVDFSFPSFCKKEPILFNNLSNVSNSGPINWLWNFGDNTFSTQYNPTHTYMNEGNDTITLTAFTVDCPSLVSQSQRIITVATPIPGFRYPTVTALKNNNTYLLARTFANSYLWSPSTGLDNPNIPNPIYNYDQSVEYLIRLENRSGCMTVDTLLVRIYENSDIQVPTGFSPNNDGHNDYLDMFLIGVKLKHFWVFNRWGQLLFETTDPRQRWDGTFKGKIQPAETYVWQAEITDDLGNNIIKRGQTILIR